MAKVFYARKLVPMGNDEVEQDVEPSQRIAPSSPGSAGRHEVRECSCSTRHRHGEGTSMPLPFVPVQRSLVSPGCTHVGGMGGQWGALEVAA